jgi:LmbE family N-acetylglucosaminyl deacetylase
MIGTPENDAPGSFWQCDVEEAAHKLAAILREEAVDVMTMYDENGVYGHPDHIKVWQVGKRAAEIAGTKKVYEGTVNRTAWMRRVNASDPGDAPRTVEFPMGVDEEQLTTAVDVKDFVDVKRQAMRAHASQITEESFFLKMPDDQFRDGFGTEWFILRGAPSGVHEYDLFTGIDA